MPVQDWSATADENTSIDGINIAEHCPAKNINNAIRSVMAALKSKCDALDRGAVIGEVRWFAMSTPPTGWLVCNGAAVGRATYPELFAAIGTTYGSGDGSKTFKLPNLIGKVPWGSSSQVGTEMEAGLPNITGGLWLRPVDGGLNVTWETNNGAIKVAKRAEDKSGCVAKSSSFGPPMDMTINASRSSSVYGNSDTVQPPALCLLPCIRYE